MAKKMPVRPRATQGTAKTDVVIRVSAEAVSRRAYSLFQARGSEHGHDVEDWLVAETELLKGNNRKIASLFAETPPDSSLKAPATVSSTRRSIPKDTTWHQ
jgi:hypothetical protein